MSGQVGLEAYVPAVVPRGGASAHADIAHPSNAPQAGSAPSARADEKGQAAPSPHVQVAVSQILMNAESLIASVLGVRANEVSISVHAGRFDF